MSSAFIPLYLNSILMNNLYTIGLTSFASDVEVQRINTKTSSNTTYTMPISEISKDMTGRYVQGEVKFQFATELLLEQYAIEITALLKLRKLFQTKGMLQHIQSPIQIGSVNEKQYVEFEAVVHHNPNLKYIERVVDFMEIDNITEGIKGIEQCESKEELELVSSKLKLKKELLNDLQAKINDYRENRCEYLVSEGICGSELRAIIPVENKHLLDNIEHLITCRVTVLGKVIKVGTLEEFGLYHRGMNYLDYIDDKIMDELSNREKSMFSEHIKKEAEEKEGILRGDDPVVLVLPISISL